MTFYLNDLKKIHSREVYSVFTMLGDLGGFMDALSVLSIFLASLVSVELFYASTIKNLFQVIYKNTEKVLLRQLNRNND